MTLVVVRNMSGIVSAPSRTPSPSTGMPAPSSTGTITMIDPPGIPGTENDVTTDVTVMPSSCDASRSTPYKRATNRTPTVCPIPAPVRNSVAESGINTLPMVGGNRRVSRTLSSNAGSAASDDRELNAIDCAGKAARAKRASGTRPSTTAAGYSTSATKTTHNPHTITMYPPIARSASSPIVAASGTANANTPSGAQSRIARTRTSDASITPSTTRTTAARRSAATRSKARPNASENTISGNIAPSTAARTGFDGTSETNHCPMVGTDLACSPAAAPAPAALARNASTAAGSSVSEPSNGPPANTPNPEAIASTMMKSTIARAPRRPTARASGAAVTPAMRLDITSGITVIRIAFTNNVPTGCSTDNAVAASALSLPARASPSATPATSAIRTFAVSDIVHKDVAPHVPRTTFIGDSSPSTPPSAP